MEDKLQAPSQESHDKQNVVIPSPSKRSKSSKIAPPSPQKRSFFGSIKNVFAVEPHSPTVKVEEQETVPTEDSKSNKEFQDENSMKNVKSKSKVVVTDITNMTNTTPTIKKLVNTTHDIKYKQYGVKDEDPNTFHRKMDDSMLAMKKASDSGPSHATTSKLQNTIEGASKKQTDADSMHAILPQTVDGGTNLDINKVVSSMWDMDEPTKIVENQQHSPDKTTVKMSKISTIQKKNYSEE